MRMYDDGGVVANTILQQLGGAGRLRAMTGAYNFIDLGNGLSFKIKNARANYIKIKLTSMDLYDVEVGRIRGNTYTVVKSGEGLYFDQLRPFIEKATGMYLSLRKGGEIEKSIKQKLSKSFELPLQMAIYVPSTKDKDINISKKEMDERVLDVKSYLAELFGGFNSAQVEGGFESSDKGLIEEDAVRVVAFATQDGFENKFQKLISKIKLWCKEWGQESIGLEFENDLFYIESGSEYSKGGMIEHQTDDGETLKYKIDENEMSIEVDFPTMEYLSENGIVMKKEARKLKDTYIFWYDDINSSSKEELEEALKVELPLYERGYDDDERDDYDDYARGGGIDDKHRIYFSSLAEVIDAINDIASENGYEVVEIFPDLSYGGISYGQTKKVKVELKWNGKEKVGKSKRRETNTLNVSIYRMDSGNYELVSYFSYEEGGMMADGGMMAKESDIEKFNQIIEKTNLWGDLYLLAPEFEQEWKIRNIRSEAAKIWFSLGYDLQDLKDTLTSQGIYLPEEEIYYFSVELNNSEDGLFEFETREEAFQFARKKEKEGNRITDVSKYKKVGNGRYEREQELLNKYNNYSMGLRLSSGKFKSGGMMADGGMMAKGGETKDEYVVYIKFRNAKKKFNVDTKYFRGDNAYQDAVKWGRKNLSNFNMDMVKHEMADGGMMAKGGEIVLKSEEAANEIKKTLEMSGFKNVKIKKGKKQFNPLLETPHWQEYIVTFDEKLADGGIMADGGEIEIDAKFKTENANWTNEKLKNEYDLYVQMKKDFAEGLIKPSKVIGTGYKSSYVARRLAKEWIDKQLAIYKRALQIRGVMAKGGKVKKRVRFVDKVESIADRLEGTKVPKRLKKDYGVRYNLEESQEAARRIAGAQLRDRKM